MTDTRPAMPPGWEMPAWGESTAQPLTPLDQAFARFLHETQPSSDLRHHQLAALTSQHYGRGHACLALSSLPAELQAAAASLPWAVGEHSPLVLDGGRLYLRRNWRAEQSVLAALRARLHTPCPAPVDLAHALATLFPSTPGAPDSQAQAPDWQMIACALATRARLTLITGGPGTGKTTTVVRLLALLQTSALRQGASLRVALAAPTGKAAARLGESIASAVALLPAEVRAHIPVQALTLHRLLQRQPVPGQASAPLLAVDLVVVDEASMIDLDMMARLLAAVPLGASLILLGDKDQLASVEAGAVMGQLCHGAAQGHYTPETVAWVRQVTGADIGAWAATDDAASPLAQQTVMLRHSRRFTAASGIGQWARAVNAGDRATVQRLWRDAPIWSEGEATSVQRLSVQRPHELAVLIRQAWQPCLAVLQAIAPGGCSDAQAGQALQALSRFQVLCAVREGPWGVLALNRLMATALGFAAEGWYPGRPVMVNRNDYNLRLMNGDVGLCLPHASGLRVAFSDGRGGIHWVLPSRLDAVESVFAMTVHKSQGSEFEHVCFVLPEQVGAVLTRELLYTGITRAKARLSLVAARPEVLARAVGVQVLRHGGLGDVHQKIGQ